jgi:hypothetical protein
MRQNDAKSWHLGISWELNKALNFSLFIFWYTESAQTSIKQTNSMDSDAEIENHERQLEQTLLQLKMAKSVAEAKQFCTTDLGIDCLETLVPA